MGSGSSSEEEEEEIKVIETVIETRAAMPDAAELELLRKTEREIQEAEASEAAEKQRVADATELEAQRKANELKLQRDVEL